jgi:hypothetical protein
MNIFESRSGRATAAILIAAGAVIGVSTLAPAASEAFRPYVQALSVISCNSNSPCQQDQNAGSGPGLEGTSSNGTGVIGDTTLNSNHFIAHAGVVGRDRSSFSTNNAGVKGLSTNGIGVAGTSVGNVGVLGSSTAFTGVSGASSSGVGVLGGSSSGVGVRGSSSSSAGVNGFSTNGTGVDGESLNSIGVFAKGGFVGSGTSIPALSVTGNSSNPDLIYACSLGGADPCTISPNSAQPQFAALNNGNVVISGQIFTSGSCSSGCSPTQSSGEKRVRMFTPQESLPTVEDFGQAQLVDGRAFVRIDPAFANTMDGHRAYLVFITPAGDNRGLYVTNKSTQGFDVRESQGGRSSIAFDYRVVAQPVGARPVRLKFVTVSKPGTSLPISSTR